MQRRVVKSKGAPEPIGPYSQAVMAGDLVFCAGQIPLDPSTGELVAGDLGLQTQRVMDNLEAVLSEAGSSLAKAVKLTVYLKDLKNFPVVNAEMQKRLSAPYPARSTVEVSALPKGAEVEIDAIAIVGPV